MKVIVDTCIWSKALRRTSNFLQNEKIVQELSNLISDSRVQMLGLIRQELLSGISSVDQFRKLKKYLSDFQDLQIHTEDYELAAEYFNKCRSKGIQGSLVDFLICAISTNYQFPIFTDDKDFKSYAKIVPISILMF